MQNNKTIAITLRFWTNNLQVNSSHGKAYCWDSGVAIIEANKAKGIAAGKPLQIQCYEDIIPAIKELFRKNKILVVSSNRRPRILSPKRTQS